MIVGVPRSGMIPAYMIGFLKNLQVVSINEFVSGNIIKFGERPLKMTGNNILVVEDTCGSGKSIDKCKKLLSGMSDKYNIKYMAIYTTYEAKHNIDISLSYLVMPRMFQWNYLNHINIQQSCFDMDGVLCQDPTEEQNDDGEKYIEFIKNARPLYIPKYKIKAIVTSRLEKYRTYTQDWLKYHNVMYDKLYMLNLPSKEARAKANAYASFKASIFNKLKNTLYFYESNRKQAYEIFKLSGKTTICVSTDEIFQS